MQVYVVTGLELGWDCVVGVFTIENDEEYAQLEKAFPREMECGALGYHIHEQSLQKFDLADFSD